MIVFSAPAFARLAIPAIAACLLAVTPAFADPVKIGFITTLSGSAAPLGEGMRNGFKLAVQEEDGKLGGVPVQLLIEDDAGKPQNARQIAERFIGEDKVKLFTGAGYTSIVEAVTSVVLDADAIFVSSNGSPEHYSGKDCNQNYFAAVKDNTINGEQGGLMANTLGYKTLFLVGANYEAGRDALSNVKRVFKGSIAGEAYTDLNQTDYSAELARIRAAKPDAIYFFEPGGLAVTFLKQYGQAGLNSIPLLANENMNLPTAKAVGDAALGIHVAVHWSADFDNAANHKFVADFRKTYGREPASYDSQGYEAAQFIAAGLKAVKGDLSNMGALREALRKTDYQSISGPFVFAHNQVPLRPYSMAVIEKNAAGEFFFKTLGPIAEHYDATAFAAECKM